MLRPKTMPYAAGLAAVVALAGCAGGGGGGTTPSASLVADMTPTTSIVGSSSAVAPTSAEPNFPPGLPAAAKKHTKAGAEAFVRHFFAQVNRSWTRPEPSLLKLLCDLKDGNTCSNWMATSQELLAKGQRYNADPVTIHRVASMGEVNGHSRLLFLGTQNRASVKDKAGGTVLTDSRKNLRLFVLVDWTSSGWRVFSVEQVSA